jgi:hypothetical protein
MKKFIAVFRITIMALLMFSSVYAEVGFSGDATVVSTYFWRGVKQFNGSAMQGTAEFVSSPIAVGYWISTMSGDLAVETDPYISISIPTGPVETSVGGTIYSYDFFAKEAYTIYEVFGSVGFGPLSASYYLTPEQRDGDVTSVYWLEVGAGTAAFGADLSATFGFGDYSAFMSPEDETVSTLLLFASKSVSDKVTVSWNWIMGLNDGMDNGFFLSAGYGF